MRGFLVWVLLLFSVIKYRVDKKLEYILESLIEVGLFVVKAIIIVVAFGMIVGAIASSIQRNKEHPPQGHISITDLTLKFKDLKASMLEEILDKKAYKSQKKLDKVEAKKNKKLKKLAPAAESSKAGEDDENAETSEGRIFVINFDGDINADGVANLGEEISAILSISEPQDQVLLRLESPGGVVHGYGHAASQLKRIKDKGLKLTVAVDEVAASGGYMMACVADTIIAAPFAIIGSIGVIAELPNFNRLLKKYDVDIEQHTAGEFKRTLTLLGENTDKGRDKFKQELEDVHGLFKSWVKGNREQLDIDKVATGEHWFGQQALDLNLVDEIGTSDDFIMEKVKKYPVYEIIFEEPKQLGSRLGKILQQTLEKGLSVFSKQRTPFN